MVRSAHDCYDGGLAVALAECCIAGDLGFVGELPITGRWDAALFGEGQSRIVVSVAPSDADAMEEICREEGVPWVTLGATGGSSMTISGLVDTSVESLADAWGNGLERAISAT